MKTMKTIAALAVLAMTATAANAADVAPSAYDWSGFYVGANAGAAWNNASVNNDMLAGSGDRIAEFSSRFGSNQTAFTGGGMLGYNFQVDNVVLGAEADINYFGFGDDQTRSFETEGGSDVVTKSSFDANWFGTIRARLGVAIDNVLIYGTGGAAYGGMGADGRVTLSTEGAPVTWKGSTDTTNWGWTVGGGAEYGIDNWSLGVEYLYVDLGDAEWKGNAIEGQKFKGSADYAFSTVRATVKYRFQ